MDRRLNSHLAHHRPQDGNTRGKGKVARAEPHPAAQCKSDGGRGAWPDTPLASKGLPSLEGRSFRSSEFALSGLADVSIEALLQEQQQLLSLGPPFMGPRARLQQWREVVQADPTLLKVISQGVRLPLNHIPPPNPRSPPMPLDLSSVVQKYTDLGVIRPLSASEVLRTQNWVQTFGRPKPNSSELRLITDLRPLNQSLQPQFFKGDHWGTVVQMLNDHPEHCWATTLDIKDFFFHLGLHRQAQRWIRVKTQSGGFQFLALPFGLQCSPFWSHRLAKPVIQFLRDRGILLTWYVDDILLLAKSPEICLAQTKFVIQLFTSLGLRINVQKSSLVPQQTVNYLGQVLNLANRSVSPLPCKVCHLRKMLHHAAPGKTTRPCVLASIAGTVLDLSKGAVNLLGFAKELMSQAGRLASLHGWYRPCLKTGLVRAILFQIRDGLKDLVPVTLQSVPQSRILSVLSTDSSDYAWGASLKMQGRPPLSANQFFSPLERAWHITRKETAALCRGVRTFLDLLPQIPV